MQSNLHSELFLFGHSKVRLSVISFEFWFYFKIVITKGSARAKVHLPTIPFHPINIVLLSRMSALKAKNHAPIKSNECFRDEKETEVT